jgi:hypothetical protein
MKRLVILSACLLFCGCSLFGLAPTLNFTSFTSLPSTQGWTYGPGCSLAFPTGINLPEGSAFSVANGLLTLNTAASGIDPNASFTFEARLRVLAVDPPPPSTTQIFSLNAILGGALYILQVADGEIRTFDPPSPGVPVDTANFHTYSIVKSAGSTTYTVMVDGVPVLTQSIVPEGAADQVIFGDNTCQSRNGIAEISSLRFTQQAYNVCLLCDSTKAAKGGSTIPIKLQLCDGSGNDLSSSSIALHAISITQISSSTSGPVEDSGNANPDYDFRFDSTLGSTGGYIFNLKTTGLATGTYNLNFTVTGDSFVYAAPFQVK